MVPGIEIVNADDAVILLEQRLAKMRSHEAGRSSHQNFHLLNISEVAGFGNSFRVLHLSVVINAKVHSQLQGLLTAATSRVGYDAGRPTLRYIKPCCSIAEGW
jgi:hypothetical protein